MPSALISNLRCWLEFSYKPKKELTSGCFYCCSPPLKGCLSPSVSPLLLIARICRQINQDQSCTWPWSRAQPDEKLLRMTHRALEPWHMLIDPVMGESSRSLLVVCHREWLHAHSLTRGVGARITRLRLNGCQVMCTLWKSVHWGVQAFRTKKTLPQRLEECYDVIGGLGCFQTSKWNPKRGCLDELPT